MEKEQFLMVPHTILGLKNLDGDNKLLLAKIISLHQLKDGCIMSNGYIGKMLGLNKSSASRRIGKLIKLNYNPIFVTLAPSLVSETLNRTLGIPLALLACTVA